METWITPELKAAVRKVFEPRYKKQLTDLEVVSIATNLTSFIEHYAKYRWRKVYGTKR